MCVCCKVVQKNNVFLLTGFQIKRNCRPGAELEELHFAPCPDLEGDIQSLVPEPDAVTG